MDGLVNDYENWSAGKDPLDSRVEVLLGADDRALDSNLVQNINVIEDELSDEVGSVVWKVEENKVENLGAGLVNEVIREELIEEEINIEVGKLIGPKEVNVDLLRI